MGVEAFGTAHQRLDEATLDRLLPLMYEELRRLARAHLRAERPDHSLQATALVHEIYLRLSNTTQLSIVDTGHFLALAARLMRQVLIDYGRRRSAMKRRGGDVTVVQLDDVVEGAEAMIAATGLSVVDLLALDEALDALATLDARQRDLVELKFFAGLSISECAAALGVSAATIERDWALAKAWLFQRLSRSDEGL